ncbi:MAG: methyltransferase domain-containing protein [Parcubacteria group bacterium]|jgi:SAM-dependent methyltransferase
MKRLNLGCGRKIKDGYVNLDLYPLPGVDVVADIEKELPFENDTFDEILTEHVLEHMHDLDPLLRELHRITKRGGLIKIFVPHFSNFGAYTDPTHKRFFGYFTMDYYTEKNEMNFYTPVRFRIRKKKLCFYITKTSRYSFENKPLAYIVNLAPLVYERFFCWIIPAQEVYYEIEPVKAE